MGIEQAGILGSALATNGLIPASGSQAMPPQVLPPRPLLPPPNRGRVPGARLSAGLAPPTGAPRPRRSPPAAGSLPAAAQ
jgi:hypothetical protein